MLTKHINLLSLEKNYPIPLRDIVIKCREFEIKCKPGINPFRTMENASDSKSLMIEILNLLLNSLRSLELAKSNTERENWYKLQRDVSNCANFLELREKELVTGTGEREMDKAKLIALLGDYNGMYRTLVLNLLKEAKKVYDDSIINNPDIPEKGRAFFWVVYELLQIGAGLYELRISSSSGSSKTVKVREPWQGMLVQSMRDEIRQSRETKIEKVQEYAAQIKSLAEELRIKAPGKEEKDETVDIKEETGVKEKMESEEQWEPKIKGGKKMDDEWDDNGKADDWDDDEKEEDEEED